MKKYLIIAAMLVVSMGIVLCSAVLLRAEQIRFSQYIAPLECVREWVDDGVTTRYFLSPDECNGVVDEEVKPGFQPSDVTTPDTGNFKFSRVVQSDAWWIVLLIVLLLAARRLYRRVSQ